VKELEMGTHTIPEDAPRQARFCRRCGHTTVHWGLRTTIEAMVEAHDMRPSGGVGEWTCSECGRHEHVIESSAPAPTEQSAADLERWECEGASPLGAGVR
jgi:ribosomal protein S14